MEDNTLVESSFSATINAPIQKVDIPAWCFTLPEAEYQSCSPAHCSAGATTSPDGRRMSINVEILGGSLIVQHYIEEVARPDHLRLVSTSDVFTPTGRTKIGVIWDLAARKIDDKTCEFTNTVQSCTTPELLDFLGSQGIPLDVFRGARGSPLRRPLEQRRTSGGRTRAPAFKLMATRRSDTCSLRRRNPAFDPTAHSNKNFGIRGLQVRSVLRSAWRNAELEPWLASWGRLRPEGVPWPRQSAADRMRHYASIRRTRSYLQVDVPQFLPDLASGVSAALHRRNCL